MKIFDPLYGSFEVSGYLEELLYLPEVRRLSQIRLLNTLTPSLGVLGELRRYSHTLGVLHLAQQTPMFFFAAEEIRAFCASVILHDVGTPPFGHLLEYHLRDRTENSWSHEKLVGNMLWSAGVPENRAHQIFGGRTSSAASTLRRLGISIELVQAIIERSHPLSALLFGSVDLDNLENVARMAWALGFGEGPATALSIAKMLYVARSGDLLLTKDMCDEVARWAQLRRAVYQIVVFDPPTVAAQAVLSEALGLALDAGLIDLNSWDLYDETLIERLRKTDQLRTHLSSFYLGRLPQLVFCVQVPGSLDELGFANRTDLLNLLSGVMRAHFKRVRCFSYVFVDRGSFSKELHFTDPETGIPWQSGRTSMSVVLYGFVGAHSTPPISKCRAVEADVIEALGSPQIRALPLSIEITDDAQVWLPFATSRD
jgi:hypothetical protein